MGDNLGYNYDIDLYAASMQKMSMDALRRGMTDLVESNFENIWEDADICSHAHELLLPGGQACDGSGGAGVVKRAVIYPGQLILCKQPLRVCDGAHGASLSPIGQEGRELACEIKRVVKVAVGDLQIVVIAAEFGGHEPCLALNIDLR